MRAKNTIGQFRKCMHVKGLFKHAVCVCEWDAPTYIKVIYPTARDIAQATYRRALSKKGEPSHIASTGYMHVSILH